MYILILITIISIIVILALLLITAFAHHISELREEADAYKSIAERVERAYEEVKKNDENGQYDMSLIQAEYYVSDSDLIKYTTDGAMEAAIQSKLAMLLSHDIIRKIGKPKREDLPAGGAKYSYIAKIKKV